MSARRPPWIWWVTGALLLLGMAGWVFWASQRERRFVPLSSVGPSVLNTKSGLGAVSETSENPSFPDAGIDPGLKNTLETIEEINRINRMNAELRKTPPPPATKPPTPIPATESATDQEAGDSPKKKP